MKKTIHFFTFKCGISLLLGVTLLTGCNANSTPSDSLTPLNSSIFLDSMLIPKPFATYTEEGDAVITFDTPCNSPIIRFESDTDAEITAYEDDLI